MKQTSERISSIAGRVLASGSPFDDLDTQVAIQKLSVRLGISHRAMEEIMFPTLRAIFDPHFADARSLAASALSQDETPDEA